MGLKRAMENSKWREINTVGICLDNRGVIQKIEDGHLDADTKIENDTWKTLKEATDKTIIIQWVPGHVGVDENEMADRVAKEATSLDQRDVPIELNLIKNKVKQIITSSWVSKHTNWRKTKDDEKGIPRSVRIELARYRTGHSLLLKRYKNKVGLTADATCDDCQEEDETMEHNLLRCPRWITQRVAELGHHQPDTRTIPATKLLNYLKAIGRIRA